MFRASRSRVALSLLPSPEPPEWIVELVHDAFLQRNDSVVCDMNAFRADLGATLGDIAVPDPIGFA